eukprot:scaffold300277_cov21-Tisochrysis_lutea.AAC.1
MCQPRTWIPCCTWRNLGSSAGNGLKVEVPPPCRTISVAPQFQILVKCKDLGTCRENVKARNYNTTRSLAFWLWLQSIPLHPPLKTLPPTSTRIHTHLAKGEEAGGDWVPLAASACAAVDSGRGFAAATAAVGAAGAAC